MKLPKDNFTVNIDGFEFDVIYSIDTTREESRFGCVNLNEQKIFLDQNLKEQQLFSTFLHECLHAMFWLGQIKINKSCTEEDVVNMLGKQLYKFVRDNDFIFNK